MRVRWTRAAAEDLEHIAEYLEEHRPAFRESTIDQLYEAAMSLKAAPHRGRAGRIAGTRELVCHPLPYLIVYRVATDAIHLLRIRHGAENR